MKVLALMTVALEPSFSSSDAAFVVGSAGAATAGSSVSRVTADTTTVIGKRLADAVRLEHLRARAARRAEGVGEVGHPRVPAEVVELRPMQYASRAWQEE